MASNEVVEEDMRRTVNMMTIQMGDMARKNARQTESINEYEMSIKKHQESTAQLQANIAARDATIKQLKGSVALHVAAYNWLADDKRASDAKRDEYEQKVKEQAYVLGTLRKYQTMFEGAKEELAAMTNYRAAAEKEVKELNMKILAIAHGLQASTELRGNDRDKWAVERSAWADERARLVAAAGNNESDIIQRYDEYLAKCAQAYTQSTKRARTDDDIGSSSSSGSSSSDA